MGREKLWEKVFGVVTPGGDPCWRCPECHKGDHVMGVETTYNYTTECPNCGAILNYPWEVVK